MAVRLFELLSICLDTKLAPLDTELAPVDILAALMAFLLGHSLASLVGNTFTVLLGDGLALLLGHGSNSRDQEIAHCFLYNSYLQACRGCLWHTSLGTL